MHARRKILRRGEFHEQAAAPHYRVVQWATGNIGATLG